jgi:hypothetical protein
MLHNLDLKAWDTWLPLSVVAAFFVLGAGLAATGLTLGVPAGDVERFHIVYTEIGV